MILDDGQLIKSQQAISNLQKILMKARKVHNPQEYRAMSGPILLEIQQREQDILDYLSKTGAEATVGLS